MTSSFRFRAFVAVISLSSVFSSAQANDRQDQELPSGWKFIKKDVALTEPTDSWSNVIIPHTWNSKREDESVDINDPHIAEGYYSGPCWYEKSLDIPADWQGKRVFIRFEAASLVSKTYLNGQLLGEHRGGFTAFCYELTSSLHFGATNELRIQVDNSRPKDHNDQVVSPLYGDFDHDGGLYRPVHLIVTNPLCISPLEMATPGVFLTTKSLSDAAAQVEIKTLVSNGATGTSILEVKSVVTDADGKVVARQSTPATVAAGQTVPVLTNLSISTPHRWNGRKDPYLYTTTVSLVSSQVTTDTIQQPLGLRTVEISEEKGFLLNGQPYAIHGVNRHQDWGDQGWAATTEDYKIDEQLILDMGVNAIRLAHYPQSATWHNSCDHDGILLWDEIPLVSAIRDTPEFKANAELQLREMILQLYNHPSVAFWGLFNELSPDPEGVQVKVSTLTHLKSVIQELDPSRLIVCAIATAKMPFNLIADHPCFNRYPGWHEKLGTMTVEIQKAATEAGKRIAISEYGAGANPDQHEEGPLTPRSQPKSSGQFHPEEWQTKVHETDWEGLKDNPLVWGSFVWNMFDFQSHGRHEGGKIHLNDKGLVTQDRKIKKDAYYFYQANWTDKPMIHIASSQMTPRRLATTEVEVFSNCPRVKLTVNGIVQDTVKPDGVNVFRWPQLTLQNGKNEIRAVAASSQGDLTDSCEWILDPNYQPKGPNETDAHAHQDLQ